jgi:hypothetical protein
LEPLGLWASDGRPEPGITQFAETAPIGLDFRKYSD